MRVRSPEGDQAMMSRTNYFAAPTPIIQELRELRARNNEQLGGANGTQAAGGTSARRNESEATGQVFNHNNH